MTREELIGLCRDLPDAAEDYPFADREKTVMRHKSNRKWFALICELEGKLCVNLKCEPMEADFLRRVYSGVRPAWHMNKTHWNTVVVDDVPKTLLLEMVRQSHALTGPVSRTPGSRRRPSAD